MSGFFIYYDFVDLRMSKRVKIIAIVFTVITFAVKAYAECNIALYDHMDPWINNLYADALILAFITTIIIGGLTLLIKHRHLKRSLLTIICLLFVAFTVIILRNIFLPRFQFPFNL